MKVHTVTVISADSKVPATWIAPNEVQVAIDLFENHANDDEEFEEFLNERTNGAQDVDFFHQLPLEEVLVPAFEEFYTLKIYLDEFEVAPPVVDPTEHTEIVGRMLWAHFRPQPDVAWEDLGPVDKQEFKQNIVGTLYAVLEALTEQGVIGGIARG